MTEVTGSDYLWNTQWACRGLFATMKEDVLVPEVFGCIQQAMATDPRGLVELCNDYLVDARKTLELLREDLRRRDAEQLRTHAHYLKGSSQVIGTKRIAACCVVLESPSNPMDVEGVTELLKAMEAAIEQAKTEMAARVGTAIASLGEPAA